MHVRSPGRVHNVALLFIGVCTRRQMGIASRIDTIAIEIVDRRKDHGTVVLTAGTYYVRSTRPSAATTTIDWDMHAWMDAFQAGRKEDGAGGWSTVPVAAQDQRPTNLPTWAVAPPSATADAQVAHIGIDR